MKIVDKRGAWYVNTTEFRQHDPMSDTYFEPHEPTKASPTDWRLNNKAIIKPCTEEGDVIDEPDEAPAPVEVLEVAVTTTDPDAKVDVQKRKQ